MIVDMNYWSKVLRRILILAVTIIGIYLGFKLAIFYMPFLIAFVLSLIIEPIIRFMMKRMKLKRKTSAIIVFFVAISLIAGLIAWGIFALISEASNLLNGLNGYIDQITQKIQELTEQMDFKKLHVPDQIIQIIQNAGDDTVRNSDRMVKSCFDKFVKCNYFYSKYSSICSCYIFVIIFHLYR